MSDSTQTRLCDQAFAGCIGHREEVERLKRMVESGRTPHALLFCGPAGVGKRRIARAVAASLLSSPGTTPLVGGQEEHALRLVSVGNHPDLHLVWLEEERKDITIEQIRTLVSAFSLKPYTALCSVAIIDDAHRMSPSACNALLKTLEEPNGHSYLILVSSAAHRLPATILSRCQTLHFRLLSEDELRAVLFKLLETSHAQQIFSAKELDLLFTFCDGTLAPLELEPFIDQRSLRVTDHESFSTHLRQIGERVAEYERMVVAMLSGKGDAPMASALDAASVVASAKQLDPLLWRTLYSVLRRTLRVGPDRARGEWAGLFLEALQAHQLINERNLSPQLQLSSLFLRAVDIAGRLELN